MLTFIVPLRSPEASKNWLVSAALCARTIHSLARQTHPDFRIILACNRRPTGLPVLPNLIVIEEGFPVPSGRQAGMEDKFLKIKRAMVEASRFSSTHLMFCDADDLISRRVCEWVHRHPPDCSWNMGKGYVHDEGTNWAYLWRPFDQLCGSSTVVAVGPRDFPASMEEDTGLYPLLTHGHPIINDYLKETRGEFPRDFPFPAGMYITGTEENWSGFSLRNWRSRKILLKKMIFSRWMGKKVREEFGLRPLKDFPQAG